MACITEEWKPIVGFEGVYSVSNFGRIRRDRGGGGTQAGKILRGGASKGGYRVAVLYDSPRRRTAAFHELVAEAFFGPRPAGFEVNHIDGFKSNNHVSNLEYVTRTENTRHANALGLRRYGQDWHFSKLSDDDVREIRSLAKHLTKDEITNRFGVSKSYLYHLLAGKSRKDIL